jgi:hypothetical protein
MKRWQWGLLVCLGIAGSLVASEGTGPAVLMGMVAGVLLGWLFQTRVIS